MSTITKTDRQAATPAGADRVMRALSSHVRRRMLEGFDDGERSTKELAAHLGLTIPNAAHHMRVLREAGLLEITREVPRRGARETFYRRAWRDPVLIDELLEAARKLERSLAKPTRKRARPTS